MNARPNVALSVRGMRHSDKSKADLRFVIPAGAKSPDDIPMTLIYCNTRLGCEDVAECIKEWLREEGLPESCVGFYHAKIGEARKRELEEKLRKGEVRILVCTDAVGMGCDLRNIAIVVLWGLPPSFCALAQHAGRAARDMTKLGEAILIVSARALKDGGPNEAEIEANLGEAVAEGEAENQGQNEAHALEAVGIQVTEGNQQMQQMLVAEGGVRVEHASKSEGEDADDETTVKKGKKKKRSSRECNLWDEFFHNSKKCSLNADTTAYKPITGARCCDNCEPERFAVEVTHLEKVPSLKRGKKKQFDAALEEYIRKELGEWRIKLLNDLFPSSFALIPAEAMMMNDIIEQLATCGDRIVKEDQVCRYTRWPTAFQEDGITLMQHGQELLLVLKKAYTAFDAEVTAEQAHLAAMPPLTAPISTKTFYRNPSKRTRTKPVTDITSETWTEAGESLQS
ncbi:hypothetical protein BKA93DRAFT_825904 [Sparassis latifolia]